MSGHYAPNFGEVEGAYWFGPVRLSVHPSVHLSEPTHGYILGRVLVEYLQFIPYRCP